MHARCMLDCAQCLASGHADPQPCNACRAKWPVGRQPPHPAGLPRGPAMPQPGCRWSAVSGALKFADPLLEDVPEVEPALVQRRTPTQDVRKSTCT